MVDNRLIINPTFQVGAQQGCCGIGTVARLASSRCYPSAKAQNIESWLSLEEPFPLLSDLPTWENATLQTIFIYLARRPEGLRWAGRRGYESWYGSAVTQDQAFAMLTQHITTIHQYAIYFMSDNVQGEGDVHVGPFNTRSYVRWLRDNDLGAVHTSGPIESRRTHHNIQGWIFVPHYGRCAEIVTAQRDVLIAEIKEQNDDPRIKEKEQQRLNERSIQRQQLQRDFSEGWGTVS